VLTPILLYGIFNVYRDKVNPRIKFSDFLFICAGVAVLANLVGAACAYHVAHSRAFAVHINMHAAIAGDFAVVRSSKSSNSSCPTKHDADLETLQPQAAQPL
jgi:hypothetical protein